jgi:hypothetical protein
MGFEFDARESAALLVKCCPSCRMYLERKMASNEGEHVELKITKHVIIRTGAIARKNSASTTGIVKGANPHTDSRRNLKRLPESVALEGRKEWASARVRMVGNNRALKRKGSK